MPRKRFEGLESEARLPDAVQSAVKRLGRFEHLEIADATPVPPVARRPGRALCPHCGHHNPQKRDFCRHCSRRLRDGEPEREPESPAAATAAAPAAGMAAGALEADITVVLDDETYHSDDPGLPEDIRALIARIRKHGYSPELLAEWRSWRATRNRGTGKRTGELAEVELFRHLGDWVIAIDGKVYRSTASALPPEITTIFDYVKSHGVTPALLEFVRRTGHHITLRAGSADGAVSSAAALESPPGRAGTGDAASALLRRVGRGVATVLRYLSIRV